jgi:hypothetical protein
MRACVCLVLAGCLGVAAADEAKKPRTYKRADVGKSLKARVGDVIVVVENVKPQDIEEMGTAVTAENAGVRVETHGNEIRIVVEAGKNGKATVAWRYTTTDGKVGGHDGLEIKVE